MDLHPIRPASKAFNRQFNLNEMIPNLTRQAYNVISMIYTQFNRAGIQCNIKDLHPIQIRPVEFDQAGIQCNVNDLHPIRQGRHTM